MNKKKALVTGGAGFIGSHIVDRLLDIGHKVVVIDNQSSDGHDNYYWNDKCENYKYDICDFQKIAPLFQGVDYVFHLAARASVQSSIDNPIPTIQTQVLGTINVLEASRLHGIEKLVYSSTSAVYGNENKIPNKEIMRENPLNPYAIGKLSGEQLVKSYYNLYGLKTVAFRYTNVYGERARHVGTYAPVISKFLKLKLQNEHLTIFGDGKQKRDFIHVSDVVNANISITHTELNSWGDVYNIGYGENFSIQEIADFISSKQIYFKEKPGEMKETLADISKAKENLTWKPKISVLDWIRSQI